MNNTKLMEYPAVVAWLVLHPKAGLPARVTTLKPDYRKSAVYLLEDFATSHSAVVAKCCPLDVVTVEDTVYRQLLPHVPYPTLRHFGTLRIHEDKIGWLFVEYSNGERFAPANPDHRRLASHWMSCLHMATARFAQEIPLPKRDSRYYQDLIAAANRTLRDSLANPYLTADQTKLLQNLMCSCELLAARWCDIDSILTTAPTMLAHGGFHQKNVRVGERDGKVALAVFDWESAGWGPPIIDLGSVDSHQYRENLGEAWPELTVERVEVLSAIGRTFGALKSIPGEAKTLSGPWPGKMVGKLQYYAAEIATAMPTLLGTTRSE